jgi:hypothetical protein
LEAIDTTRGYVTQTGVKEEDTVGLYFRGKYEAGSHSSFHVLSLPRPDGKEVAIILNYGENLLAVPFTPVTRDQCKGQFASQWLGQNQAAIAP